MLNEFSLCNVPLGCFLLEQSTCTAMRAAQTLLAPVTEVFLDTTCNTPIKTLSTAAGAAGCHPYHLG